MNLLDELSNEDKKCTGCGACYNICPVNAIEMEEDKEGFLYPKINLTKCIDCKICKNICPCLNAKFSNTNNPKCYAMMAKDDERLLSSSGGISTLIARDFIKKNGVVFGAAWAKDWRVNHISVDNQNDLSLIRGSKYIQSDTKKTYLEVKKYLAANKKVLYTGMPCQIAGLYGFLKDIDYSNLLTVEILCHGTPSYKVLNKYLTDNYDKDNIVDVNFRDKKKFGWSTTTTITITMANGDVKRISDKMDSFYQAFLPCMIMRPSCSTCQFSILPRQGDITVGDFWGIERYNKKFTDNKGTSLVLINNKKGDKYLQQLKSIFQLWEEVPIEYAIYINKTIIHPFRSHSGRKHFFSIFERKNFNNAVINSLSHHYDIGIIGLWYGKNYGSILTYYALYQLLCEMGYDVVMLPKPNTLWDESFNNPNSIAQKFIWKYCNVFLPCDIQEKYRNFNDLCDNFIVGSDVVWDYKICGRDSDQFFFMDWVEHGHKKIAFASSCGNGLYGSDKYIKKAVYNLNKFDAISCREQDGIRSIDKYLNKKELAYVLDPVFICDRLVYEKIIMNVNNNSVKENIIFSYILRRDTLKYKENILEYACKKYNASLKICCNPNDVKWFEDNFFDCEKNISVEVWLHNIKNCSMYIGDSYHALCFSIIFHRPFIIVYNPNGINTSISRFTNLLNSLGLEDRLIYDLNDDEESFKKLVDKKINWENVDFKLSIMKKRSFQWLKDALEKTQYGITAEEYMEDELKRKLDEYSANVVQFRKKIQQYDTAFKELTEQLIYTKKEVNFFKSKLENMINKSINKIYCIDSFLDYLSILNENKEEILICISVKDTPGLAINDIAANALTRLGCSDFRNKHWCGYTGIIYKGKVILDDMKNMNEVSNNTVEENHININIISKPYNSGNCSIIKINGKNYAVNKRGINIVVWSIDDNKIVDSVAFDTHVQDFTSYRF